MDEDYLLPLLAPLLVTPAVWWAARRWHPRLAAWVVTLVAVASAGASTLALLLLAVAATAVHEPAIAITAVTLLLASATAVSVAAWRRATELRTARSQAAYGRGQSMLVVLPDDMPVAYALPGNPGQIVVSRGMIRALSADQRRALLAHERTHLSANHHRFLVGMDLACAANPVLWPLRATVRYAVERWADESAASTTGDRRLTARAIATAALAGRAARTGAAVTGATSGPVPQRVAALLAQPEPAGHGRRLVMGLAVVLAITSVAAIVDIVVDLHELLS